MKTKRGFNSHPESSSSVLEERLARAAPGTWPHPLHCLLLGRFAGKTLPRPGGGHPTDGGPDHKRRASGHVLEGADSFPQGQGSVPRRRQWAPVSWGKCDRPTQRSWAGASPQRPPFPHYLRPERLSVLLQGVQTLSRGSTFLPRPRPPVRAWPGASEGLPASGAQRPAPRPAPCTTPLFKCVPKTLGLAARGSEGQVRRCRVHRAAYCGWGVSAAHAHRGPPRCKTEPRWEKTGGGWGACRLRARPGTQPPAGLRRTLGLGIGT